MNDLSSQGKLGIGESMKLSVKIWKEGKWYIARIPELGVVTQGRTKDEVKKNLKEAAELQLSVITGYAINY